MEVKLIDTTNGYILGGYKDMCGDISIMSTGGAIVKGWEYRDQGFRTSLIDTIEQKENKLIIKTLNSAYEFEILEGSLEDLNLSPIEENRGKFEKFKALNKQKHTEYFCQVVGGGMIDQAISITRLPEPMKKAEAMEYARDNVLLDAQGNAVGDILAAVESFAK